MVYSEKDIYSEEDFINIIKLSDLNKIKEILKFINVNQLSFFNKVLFNLIEEHFSFNIIKFFIDQQQQPINNTELLFHSIGCNNYEVASLLIKYGIRINDLNIKAKNIIEYLLDKKKLNSRNLLFILNIVKDSSIITSKI